MTKKTVEERLNVELGLADDIISEFENPVEVDDTRIVSARRERHVRYLILVSLQ